jgi:hypothetical protein
MISAYLVLVIYAMSIDLFSIIYLYLQKKLLLSILILLWTIVNNGPCILARQGKKKAMAGSKAAAQQNRISGPPQQVYVPVPCSDVHTSVDMPVPHGLQPLSNMFIS